MQPSMRVRRWLLNLFSCSSEKPLVLKFYKHAPFTRKYYFWLNFVLVNLNLFLPLCKLPLDRNISLLLLMNIRRYSRNLWIKADRQENILLDILLIKNIVIMVSLVTVINVICHFHARSCYIVYEKIKQGRRLKTLCN